MSKLKNGGVLFIFTWLLHTADGATALTLVFTDHPLAPFAVVAGFGSPTFGAAAGSANFSNKELPTRARFNMNESDMTSIKLSPGEISSELRLPLMINAIFGIASGLLFLIAPGMVGGWLGVDIDGWLRVFGALILGHGLMILALLPKVDTAKLAKLNLSMIAPYPILMIVVVVTGMVSRPLGQGLALVDGLIIAGVAAWHFKGLKSERSATLPQHA